VITDECSDLLRRKLRLLTIVGVWRRIVAGSFSKGLCTATVLSITIVALAGGCNHTRPTAEGATAASKGTVAVSNEVSPAMIGKQITIRGKLLLGKIGWYISLDNQQEVYFLPGRSSAWGSYDEMRGKLVTATGILRVFQCPRNPLTDKEGRAINKEGRVIDRCSDYFYFEAETDQPQILPDEGADR
jgi:hypothetical protein